MTDRKAQCMKNVINLTVTCFFFIIILGLLAGCSSLNKKSAVVMDPNSVLPDSETLKNELLEMDRRFSQLSVSEGTVEAFEQFIAPDCTILRQGTLPVSGRKNIKELLSRGPQGVMSWEPEFADVSAAGDLGYTIGKYTFTYKSDDNGPKTGSGFYVTIWKKQPDGVWKVVFDTGNQSPHQCD